MEALEFCYLDEEIAVCVKPPGVLSTDEAGGMPSLVRAALGDPCAEVRTVHRLDRVVGGLMVLARSERAASELSRQIRAGAFDKAYQAVLHGAPQEKQGELCDLLARDRRTCTTYVVPQTGKGVQEARLEYRVTAQAGGLTRVWIRLQTGRTHQIRVQFASRALPLVGDRKYGGGRDDCGIALWSCMLAFHHPATGEAMRFRVDPPACYPWTEVPE